MQAESGEECLGRHNRRVLGNSLLLNSAKTNGSDRDARISNLNKNPQEFKVPQMTSIVTSTPKNCERKKSIMADSMQTTYPYSSVDMGYSTMRFPNDPFRTPISGCSSSRNMTASSEASSETSAPSIRNTAITPCDSLRTQLMHCESGYVSDESRSQKLFPSYYHSTPYVTGNTNRMPALGSDSSIRSIPLFPKLGHDISIGHLNLSEISAEQESLHETSHCPRFLLPQEAKLQSIKSDRSQQIKNYFSYDESQGRIGSNICKESFSLLLGITKQNNMKITSTILDYLEDSDISRLFLVSKELRTFMESNERAVSRRERFLDRVKQKLTNKENTGRARMQVKLEPRPGPRRPLGLTQSVACVEKRRRDPSENKSFDEMINRDGVCIHCSSCWKTASVLGIIATCSSPNCGFRRCMRCGRRAHDNRPCIKRQSVGSTQHSVGSIESKKNLKRIAKCF